jgi:4-hydroxybenzoate polyprenyltransferase
VLAGVRPTLAQALGLGVANSLAYIGGMFLNDAFDRHVDAREGAERPIPQGLIAPSEVLLIGFGLLAGSLLLLSAFGRALGGGVALTVAIVVYDLWHKGNPLSPVLMALCRMLVYVTAALGTSGRVPLPVLAGALVLGAYVVALSWWSKRGGSRVGELIAGIALVDGAAIVLAGAPLYALGAAAAFVTTLRLQRLVRGT